MFGIISGAEKQGWLPPGEFHAIFEINHYGKFYIL